MEMKDLELLKIKREFALLKNRYPHPDFKYSVSKSFSIEDINFLIRHYKQLNDIVITQNSKFYCFITYSIYNKDKLLTKFEENLLFGLQRMYMDELISSKTNKDRHKKFKIKAEILKLSDINY